MLKKIKIGLVALLLPLIAFAQSYPSPTFNNLTVQGTFTATGKVTLASLAIQAANTVVANVTASSASPTAVALPSCSTANSALQYTSATGFSCGTTFALTGGTLAQFAATTSAQLAGVISDETGSGALVFATSPTLVTPALGAATATTPTAGDASTRVATTAFLAIPGPIGNTTANTGKFTTLQATSTITPSSTAGIVGTATNDSANAGSVGELISSTVTSGSAVALTTNTSANITSITLTAGDWDVQGTVYFTGAASTVGVFRCASVSQTTATLDLNVPNYNIVDDYGSTPFGASTGNTNGLGVITPTIRKSLTGSTTIFLVAQASFSVSTQSAYGTIRARRVR